jgi:hypothetical protein
MIRYALNCEQGHTFESWFQNSAAYDKQAKRGLRLDQGGKSNHGAAAVSLRYRDLSGRSDAAHSAFASSTLAHSCAG